jgi:hypothetical protein
LRAVRYFEDGDGGCGGLGDAATVVAEDLQGATPGAALLFETSPPATLLRGEGRPQRSCRLREGGSRLSGARSCRLSALRSCRLALIV